MTTIRLHPDVRKEEILKAALAVASREGGWANLTRITIADEAKCAQSLVSHYFGTMINLRRAIMRAAITSQNLSVISQGILAGDKHAKKVSTAIREKAFANLMLG